MAEKLIKTLTSDAGDERVLIIHRADGVFTYQRQWRDASGWGMAGIDAGLFDSAETAENEARAKVPWLVPLFH